MSLNDQKQKKDKESANFGKPLSTWVAIFDPEAAKHLSKFLEDMNLIVFFFNENKFYFLNIFLNINIK